MRGSRTLKPTGHVVEGVCGFEPWGPGGLPDPIDDAVGEACGGAPALGSPDWATRTTFRWDLKPARS